MSRALLGALVLFAAVLSGCGQDSAALQRPICFETSDCDASQICQAGVCRFVERAGPNNVHIEVAPPDGSGFATTHLLNVSLADQPALALTLPQPVPYQIVVYDVEQPGQPPRELDSNITVIARNRIPGREISFEGALRAGIPSTQRAVLLEGDYRVLIQPSNRRPSLETTFSVRGAGGPLQTKDFQFQGYRRIYGQVTSSVSMETKLQGVLVTAYSQTSGLPSTSTTTDSLGRYSIELPETPDEYFRLIAIAPEELQPTWGFQEIVRVGAGENRNKDIGLETTRASIKGEARIRIGAHIDREGFVPAVGASVILTTTTSEGLDTRFYRVDATTDAEGYVHERTSPGARTVRLLRGTYRLEVVPQSDSPFGRLEEELELLPSPMITPDVQRLLPIKTHVLGSVRSGLGRPVPWATVELHAIGVDVDPVVANTDGDGNFQARVEAGDYLISVLPSSHSDINEALPVAVQRVSIKPDSAVQSVTISLPRAVSLFGAVLGGGTGVALEDSRVEFFVEREGKVISLGDTRTDFSGAFEAVLPESIEE